MCVCVCVCVFVCACVCVCKGLWETLLCLGIPFTNVLLWKYLVLFFVHHVCIFTLQTKDVALNLKSVLFP